MPRPSTNPEDSDYVATRDAVAHMIGFATVPVRAELARAVRLPANDAKAISLLATPDGRVKVQVQLMDADNKPANVASGSVNAESLLAALDRYVPGWDNAK